MSRDADVRRLDAAIEQVEEILNEPLPAGDVQLVVAMNWRKIRLEAADRLVALLERRAKLLGLDAKPSDAEPTKEAGPVARIMAVRPTGSG